VCKNLKAEKTFWSGSLRPTKSTAMGAGALFCDAEAELFMVLGPEGNADALPVDCRLV
jgi:hypothetical protein